MNQPTSRKPSLTAEEKEIAAFIKATIANTPGLTEEIVGNAVGVTQGQISHWSGGRLRVPAERAPALAQALGVDDPGRLSLPFRKLQAHGVREQPAPYGTRDEEISALRRELDAVRALVVCILTIGATHRPVEAADVVHRIRKQLHPSLAKEATVAETLKTIDRLLARPSSPKKAGAAGS